MPHIKSITLTDYIDNIFRAAGAPDDHARLVAEALVGANLAGHDSHGVIRTMQYLDGIASGDMDPTAKPTIEREQGVVTMMDGHRGFGQVNAQIAMAHTIGKARQSGMAATGLYQTSHIGRVGQWVEMAAAEGMIGMAFCNGGRPNGLVTPHQGAARRFSTNPIAAAVPREGAPPIVLDFATSVVAEGKVRVALNAGKELDPGRLLDKHGNPSTTPADLYDSGMLLPAAGHKGYALALLMDLLGGILTGSGTAAMPVYGTNNGTLFMALDIAAFRPLTDFLADAAALSSVIKDTPPAAGYDEVLLPGEPELNAAAVRRMDGIPLDETTWMQLAEAAATLDVPVPS